MPTPPRNAFVVVGGLLRETLAAQGSSALSEAFRHVWPRITLSDQRQSVRSGTASPLVKGAPKFPSTPHATTLSRIESPANERTAGAVKVFTETASGVKTDRAELAKALRVIQSGETLLVLRPIMIRCSDESLYQRTKHFDVSARRSSLGVHQLGFGASILRL
jgi:hypothetical protein